MHELKCGSNPPLWVMIHELKCGSNPPSATDSDARRLPSVGFVFCSRAWTSETAPKIANGCQADTPVANCNRLPPSIRFRTFLVLAKRDMRATWVAWHKALEQRELEKMRMKRNELLPTLPLPKELLRRLVVGWIGS